MEEESTQLKGKITEIQVSMFLLKNGYIVSQPLIDTRYDFLIEKNNNIYRIQVKTSRIVGEDEAIEFNTCNTHTNTKGTFRRNYKDEIDYFATYWNNEVYLIPVEECGSRSKKLRIKPAKNGQIKGISFLKDYELNKILPND